MYKTYFNYWLLCLISFWICVLFLNQGPETSTLFLLSVSALMILGTLFFCVFNIFLKGDLVLFRFSLRDVSIR